MTAPGHHRFRVRGCDVMSWCAAAGTGEVRRLAEAEVLEVVGRSWTRTRLVEEVRQCVESSQEVLLLSPTRRAPDQTARALCPSDALTGELFRAVGGRRRGDAPRRSRRLPVGCDLGIVGTLPPHVNIQERRRRSGRWSSTPANCRPKRSTWWGGGSMTSWIRWAGAVGEGQREAQTGVVPAYRPGWRLSSGSFDAETGTLFGEILSPLPNLVPAPWGAG